MECILKRWERKDAAELAAALNNKRIHDNLRDGLPFPYTQADAEDYIASMMEADPDKVFAFAIRVENTVVGSIGAFRQNNIHARTAELGYYLAQEYWGKGLMTQAVKQLCAYVFSETDILRIFAEPFAYNTASCRVLEKAGFSLEGVLRSNAVKNGNIIDMKMYAIISQSHESILRCHFR